MPDTQEFLNQVHTSIEAAQAQGGMTKENIKKMQKLLSYYPEMKVKQTGVLDDATKRGVNSFYTSYWKNPNASEREIIDGEMRGMQGDFSDGLKMFKKEFVRGIPVVGEAAMLHDMYKSRQDRKKRIKLSDKAAEGYSKVEKKTQY